MKIHIRTLVLLVLALITCEAPSQVISLDSSKPFLYRVGDDPTWSQLKVDHTEWQSISSAQYIEHDGVFWIRIPLTISKTRNSSPKMLRIKSLMSFELYFDNELLFTNGKASESRLTEIAGKIHSSTIIPARMLSNGKHVIAIRASSHSLRNSTLPISEHSKYLIHSFQIERLAAHQFYPSYVNYLIFASVLIALSLGFYLLFTSLIRGNSYDFLVMGLVSIIVGTIGLTDNFDTFYNYPYSWQPIIWNTNALLSFTCYFLIPLVFLLSFKLKQWKYYLAILAAALPILIAISEPEFTGRALAISCIAVSLAIHIESLFRKIPLSWLSLVGLLTVISSAIIDFDYFFLAFDFLIICILIRLSIFERKQKKQLVITRLRKATLEAELVKRSIQPHFILNTLGALMEFVETNTEKSLNFIVALAEEFRLYSTISKEDLIPVEQEIALCNKHVEIMAMRLNSTIVVQAMGFNKDDTIPPGVFHTVLENAFSYNDYSNNKIIFSITKMLSDELIIWELSGPVIGTSDESNYIGQGIGTQYIQARLEQTYGQNWKFLPQLDKSSWKATIMLPK